MYKNSILVDWLLGVNYAHLRGQGLLIMRELATETQRHREERTKESPANDFSILCASPVSVAIFGE
jgi:hypothetical protein